MDWGSLVERKIQEAMQAGEFDSLPGQGRKLSLEEDALIDRSWWTAFKLLKNAGLAPDWIEAAKEVRGEMQIAREQLDAARRTGLTDVPGWEKALERFRIQVQGINRKIDSLNLKVPSSGLQMTRMEIESEVAASRERIGP